jgi:hypothetical protein
MIVACHFDPGSPRARMVAEAMFRGIEKAGDKPVLVRGHDPIETADAAVAYGWGHPTMFDAYRQTGRHFVYVDLGYWDRKPIGDPNGGFHKVVVDGREPCLYFRRDSSPDRFARQGLKIAPWRQNGSHVLLAGMSAKSAQTRSFAPQEWEKSTIEILRRVTKRPIVYRPKPSWAEATPIEGTIFSPANVQIGTALRDCWAVVTLHSNVAVDALVAGIPVNVFDGVAHEFSTPIMQIEDPRMPDGREQLFNDIGFVQWSISEMVSGECWRHLRTETPLAD